MTREQFEQCVHEAFREIPESIRSQIRNVAFIVEDDPRAARRAERQIRTRGILLGLYQGIPLPHRSAYYSGVLPDKITLFQSSIERIGGSDSASVRRVIRNVVHHEVAHYLGMTERDVRAWERKRRLLPGKKG
ncbi:MAG: metallopeptidase family protein [Patescibacteria group bacterium]|nr:metallopeptidase family protein [Patescibacteria group bacterium]MDD5716055.1 metallopeptidase family protein [Patescibacteria group bacterium]